MENLASVPIASANTTGSPLPIALDQLQLLNATESQATLDIQSLEADNDNTDYESLVLAEKLQETINTLKTKIEVLDVY